MSSQALKTKILKEIRKPTNRTASINQIVQTVIAGRQEYRIQAAKTLRELISKGEVTVDAKWRLHATS